MAAATLTVSGGVGRDRAVVWSLLGHGVLVLLILLGGIVVHRSPPLTQLAIKATVVDPDARRQPRTVPNPIPKPAPEPEPIAEPAPAPAPAPEPDRRLEEQQAAKAKAQRAEKQRQEKVAADRASKAKAEADRASKVRAEAERAKVDAERAKAARLKDEAARRAAAEAASKQEIARQLAEEERLLAAADSGALAAYLTLIRQKVERNWVRPPGAKPGLECEILVTQIPGGQVAGVRMGNCNADDAVRRSIEAAVLRASPLPLPDEAALFERNLRFIFKPEQ